MSDRCTVPPEGWWCSREKGHEGPCAARMNTRATPPSPADWWKPEPGDPFWMLEAEDGEWLKNAHSLLGTREASKALRFPTEVVANDHPARMTAGTKWWSAKATEHLWVSPSPAGLACTVPPEGWWCSRQAGHDGPCAAIPDTGDKLVDLIRNWMMSEDYPISQWERDFATAIRALSDQPDSTNEGLAELLREARNVICREWNGCTANAAPGSQELVERIDTALSTVGLPYAVRRG